MTTAQPASSTSSPAGARLHARAQGGTVADEMPTVPARRAPDWAAAIAPGDRMLAETVAAGNYTTAVLDRGTVLELTDLDGDAAAHLLLFNRDETSERLNVADTLKVQWQAYLAAGSVLLSDRGRALATIVADTSGHHDAFAGASTLRGNTRRYGDGAAQSATPAGRELLILAAAKHGLQPRDIHTGVTFFQGTTVDPDGTVRFTGSAGAGARVQLQIELPVVALIANAAHPLDGRELYSNSPVKVRAWAGSAVGYDDLSAVAETAPEAARAYANTLDYLGARGGLR
ncbi:urea amidolyase associated protein UAAP1 [Subtercola endophyticus]|uniref:urea amidolyase associated protein UAAP1 n=1 Tax=Subtercola endophyticus TaxID=2895559 RepID=UPI001E494BAE|nr:urea amidolyase associated protein UAAP1 [Subtercola endophyticus]UFS58661.1 DUF1989 domain-containing protein [Subtercola endophyticus]